MWRKAWADISNAYLERAGRPERIDHRSNAERGIDELPTVHMGVAACQMEKKGIATEKGELNRNIQKANRLIREIRAQIGKLKEWIGELFKARETAPEQPPQSPGLANLLMKYLSVQREKSRKYSQSWQRQHAADELKTVAKAVNYLSEHGISTLDELDAALSSVSDQADAIREGMMEIAKKRNWKYEGKTTLYQALELHRLVYTRIPDNEKDPSVEAKYEKHWQREKADYDTWVKAAPARRAAAEKAMQEMKLEAEYQEAKRQIRAEKEAKLRHQYEEKTKEVDDWFNAIASAQDGTVYSDWHDSRIPVDGVDADTYRRREFLRDEKKDQYRKEYEEALRELDDDE